jgi:hypothetical protein
VLGLGGGGGRIQSDAEKKGRGCDYHEVDNDKVDDVKKGKQGKKILMIVFQSISA